MTPQCVSTPYTVGNLKDKYIIYIVEGMNRGGVVLEINPTRIIEIDLIILCGVKLYLHGTYLVL
jgi:hypothetical protein